MKTNLKITVIILFLAVFCGCQPKERSKNERTPVNDYPFYEITIDQLPEPQNVRGILVMGREHPAIPCYFLVIGDKREIERIVGFHLSNNCEQPSVEQDKEWIRKFLEACRKAERNDGILGTGQDSRLTFVTDESAEMLPFGIRKGKVLGKGYKSKELEEYLMQLCKKHNIPF